MYKKCFKRVFDFVIALIALLIIWPFLAIITIWLHFANRGSGVKTLSSLSDTKCKSMRARLVAWFAPVFFLQERPGKDGKLFRVIKFKTMTDERDEEGNLLPDEERLTKVGRIIRSTSIDELPQLMNVLKGDMSFIGPRPLYVNFLKLYNETQARRHEVRPGLSGWAQVHGRNLCTYSKKFEYDVWYVDHISFLTDMKILFLTIKNVFCRENIGVGSGNNDEVDDLGFTQRLKNLGLREE